MIIVKIINLYISYKLDRWSRDLNTDFTLSNCLFGSVKLTKNADPDKCKYSSYGIGFDSCSEISFADGSMGKYVIIVGAYMSSSEHIDNKNKDILILDEGPTRELDDILILDEGPTQELDDTTLTTEAKYPINFTESEKRFALNLHDNGNGSFLFVNATKM